MIPLTLPKILQPFYCEDLIRLGKDFDGGYLVNSADIQKTDNLLSFGIGSDISFEQDFLKLNNCELIAYDQSAQGLHTDFFVDKQRLNCVNVANISTTDTIGFSDIVGNITGMIFLKCDIEGSEFEIFDSIIEFRNRFSGIVIEIHDIANYDNFNNMTAFMSKLKMDLVHFHINNYSLVVDQNGNYTPNVVELTFTSSENVKIKRDLTLPNILDMPCDPNGRLFRIGF